MDFDDDDSPPLLAEAAWAPRPDADDKIPITLLTGFLGAGKSTLLEYILPANHGYKIAVCMNDFGDSTDIEASSMTLASSPTSQSTQFLSLPNGCLCCSIKEPGIAAIENMVDKQPERLDWVVVELTGIADPAEIAKSFWTNEDLGGRLRLDAVVCVVDARNVEKQLVEAVADETKGNECRRQIACSDVLLLNKMDLVDAAQTERVQRTLGEINPAAPIIQTTRSVAPLDKIYRIGAFSENPKDLVTLATASAVHANDHEHDHAHSDHSPKPASNPHTGSIRALTLPLPIIPCASLPRLETWLQRVLWESRALSSSPADSCTVLRAKGLIRLEDGRRFVLQGVRDLFELKELRKEQNGAEGEGEAEGKIVLLGMDLPEQAAIARDLADAIGRAD